MRTLLPMRAALENKNVFGKILPGASWAAWRVLLIAAMGEELTPAERVTFKELTGRSYEPEERVEEFWAIIGRRGGKTRAIAVLAAYISCFLDFSDLLAPGEYAQLPILSQTVDQSQKCLSYLNGIFTNVPALKKLVTAQTQDSITLSTRVVIECRPANFRTIRGGTAIAVICDEVAYWRSDSLANPDAEILAAVRPCLATTQGMLACISSPYSRKGEVWSAYKKYFGEGGDPSILIARAASRTTNPSLPQKFVDRQVARDPSRAKAEYFAEFRSDIESYVGEEAVEACIFERGRLERAPMSGQRYYAFVDPAGGSGQDSMTLAIVHKERNIVIVDKLCEVRPPFSPEAVVVTFIEVMARYHIHSVTGDRYGGEFVREQFKKRNVSYVESERTKSDYYKELLPLINTRMVDLLDDRRLVSQLTNLECRTARGTGRDVIDHPRDLHDDLANALAGAVVVASQKRGAMIIPPEVLQRSRVPYRRRAA